MKENRGKKPQKEIIYDKMPEGLKVLLGTFKEKNPDIELKVKEVKKAEDKI